MEDEDLKFALAIAIIKRKYDNNVSDMHDVIMEESVLAAVPVLAETVSNRVLKDTAVHFVLKGILSPNVYMLS